MIWPAFSKRTILIFGCSEGSSRSVCGAPGTGKEPLYISRTGQVICRCNALIPNCDLTLHSEMREKHHGTQPFFVISQFGECLAKDLNQFLQRGKDAIVQVFLAQFLPQM